VQGVEFEPTEEQRRLVRAMAGFGIRQDDIAAHLEIDPKTLRKHFRRELDRGAVEANAKVAQSLFNMATQGNNVAAAIFWMKARAGWREKHDLELTGKDGRRSSLRRRRRSQSPSSGRATDCRTPSRMARP